MTDQFRQKRITLSIVMFESVFHTGVTITVDWTFYVKCLSIFSRLWCCAPPTTFLTVFFFLSLDLFWCHCLRPEKQGLIVFPSSFPSAPWMVCVRHAHVLLLLSWGSRYDKGSAGVPLPPPAPTPVRSAPLALWPYTGVDSIYSVFLYLGGDLVFSRSSACF